MILKKIIKRSKSTASKIKNPRFISKKSPDVNEPPPPYQRGVGEAGCAPRAPIPRTFLI